MNVSAVYINTHRYDYEQACICAASVRYWYPDIAIFLIKDFGNGDFDTALLEKKWGVRVFKTQKRKFGWGYGKLEPLFAEGKHSFLVLDSDTVLTGPVIDVAALSGALFIVDDEVQPESRFNEIYYNLERINELDRNFIYPGYSFNSGQWFGTSGVVSRSDFGKFLEWSEPPQSKYPGIIFKGDQSILNFILHSQEQYANVPVERRKIMIWPAAQNADLISLEDIKKRKPGYPYIIHWAGMKFKKRGNYPRLDILQFYRSVYYTRLSLNERLIQTLYFFYLPFEKWLLSKSNKQQLFRKTV